MKMNLDCKYYKGTSPCIFHKLDGRLCRNCKDYMPLKERILIVKLGSLGDVLRTTSILPAFKKAYPHSHITWITKKESLPLLKNNSFLNEILVIEDNYLEYILSQKYDISVSLDLELKSAAINAICKASKKKGFIADKRGRIVPVNRDAEEWYQMSLNDSLKKSNRKSYFEHIYRICRLKLPCHKPQYNLNKEEGDFAIQFKKKHRLNGFRKIIGINTGGGGHWQLKKWIQDYCIRLGKLIKGHYPEVGILLYGGPMETEFNRRIAEEAKALITDTGCHNSIGEFAGLISLSDIFLTPDSLGMHLSLALSKRVIVLVGPTSPWEIDLFGKGDVVYNKGMDCIGCYLLTCDKAVNCMNSLSPEQVFKILEKYIAK